MPYMYVLSLQIALQNIEVSLRIGRQLFAGIGIEHTLRPMRSHVNCETNPDRNLPFIPVAQTLTSF